MSCSLQAARTVLLVALALVMAASPAFAQGAGSSTTLSGLVVDAQGAVIPGADVVAKNNATAAEFRRSRTKRADSPSPPYRRAPTP